MNKKNHATSRKLKFGNAGGDRIITNKLIKYPDFSISLETITYSIQSNPDF